MLTKIINVQDIAQTIENTIYHKLLKKNIKPHLLSIMIGDNPASQIYVSNKAKKCQMLNIRNTIINLDKDVSCETSLEIIQKANQDDDIDGILLQAPLPPHLNFNQIISYINPTKDIDGLHPLNYGYLSLEKNLGDINTQNKYKGFVPCTPLGCINILKSVEPNLSGKKAVVIGRSILVGLPMLQLLINNDCTTTLCHSFTKNLKEITQNADIIISAVGNPKFLTSDFIKKDSIIIDVGISRLKDSNGNSKIVGDVDLENVIDKAKHITKVPGGVGKTTIACLMYNVSKKFI